jgi:shikimate dehydrogenase
MGMLVNQGVISIRHWTGVDVDPAVMRRTLEVLFPPASGAHRA